MGQDD